MVKSRLVMAIGAALFVASCASTSPQNTNTADTQKNTPTIQANSLASAQGTAALTMEQIMADPDWMGRFPEQAFWSMDGEDILFYQKREGSDIRDLMILENGAGEPQKVAVENLHQYVADEKVHAADDSFLAYTFEGNIFVRFNDGSLRQLTRDDARQHNLQPMTNGQLSYQQDNNFFVIDVNSGLSRQVASLAFKEKPKANEEPKDYLAREEQELIQFVQKERQAAEERFEKRSKLQKENATLAPEPFYLPENKELVSASLSPKGDFLLVAITEPQSWRDEGDIMPNYISEDGRVKSENVRRRVADAKPVEHQLVLLNLTDGSQSTLTYNTLPGWNEDVLAEVKRENHEARGETYKSEEKPRPIMLMADWGWENGAIQWNEEGTEVAVMLEAWDNKDRWLATVDTAGKKFVSQDRLHDDAWINYTHNEFGWLDSDELWFMSEADGYSHLYVKPLGGNTRQLTEGNYVVEDADLSSNGDYLYFQANIEHPGIYEVYRVKTDGKDKPEALTDLDGMTAFELSPESDELLLTHSTPLMPPELYHKAVDSSQTAKRLTHTVSEKFLSIDWTAPEVVGIESSHVEEPIYTRIYKPEGFDENRAEEYPAVVFIHGAGYLQNAHMGWSGYFREFMFHSLLNKNGYVVADLDYRGSKGYGRDWRTAIYRQMGTPEVEDLVDVANYLESDLNVDGDKLGTYGGSYGGFLTFMALFKEPGLFEAGSALRPVTDWAHYNTSYTSNILNLPQDDTIAYRRSSPIYFAEGLEDALLINSPMVDDNVFFQDSVRLVQRLIELKKEDWETAIYPVEPHGFRQPESWLNEYRRIFKLFEENLK
ncbi:prolyl oligopeptidase family serine peptidase [Idiomarina sp. M1R2S28]|uniref:Prolyl oligopeptidase family serine peptidase n=1 Tax=Idiomarina rhizosphaerae TaxID=2961572 RepID=A0A9X2G413_9GAMM|nr:prolyl oligopeptidase family serine peptidase [Idiomarina rhizosphaerae]MCP1339513.1 prolyl oligopeptidase family serine peptidase [Idiomarina rhizosphaerae]